MAVKGASLLAWHPTRQRLLTASTAAVVEYDAVSGSRRNLVELSGTPLAVTYTPSGNAVILLSKVCCLAGHLWVFYQRGCRAGAAVTDCCLELGLPAPTTLPAMHSSSALCTLYLHPPAACCYLHRSEASMPGTLPAGSGGCC